MSSTFETPQKILRNKHLENVQKNTKEISFPSSPLMKKIGFGTGVNVYRYDRKSASPWAIKKVSRTMKKQKVFQNRIDFEAEIIRKLSHPNIVGFRAIEFDSQGNKSIAMECLTISLGDLLEKRLECNLGSLSPKKSLRVIGDISNALEYLHYDVKILHGDIKSHNVLIKNNFEVCKLCDFGVALPLNDNQLINFKENNHLHYVGTELWSAPEVIDEEDIICAKADIFSLGLVVYEMLALIPPHSMQLDDVDDENEEEIKETSIVCGSRPAFPEDFICTKEYNKILEIFYHCTSEYPEDRPSSKVLVNIISDISDGGHLEMIEEGE